MTAKISILIVLFALASSLQTPAQIRADAYDKDRVDDTLARLGGRLIPDDHDTTLLKMVFGSYHTYHYQDTSHGVAADAIRYYYDDSVKIAVTRPVSDDTSGLFELSSSGYDFSDGVWLRLLRVANGWKVTEAYKITYEEELSDKRIILGRYNDIYQLVNSVNVEITYRDHIVKENTLYIQLGDNYSAIRHVLPLTVLVKGVTPDDSVSTAAGTWKCKYNAALNCFRVNYDRIKTITNKGKSRNVQSHQVWYINADTIVQTSGAIIDKSEMTKRKIHLDSRTICRIFKPNPAVKHSFVRAKGIKMESGSLE